MWFVVDEYYSETTTTQACLGYVSLGHRRATTHTFYCVHLTSTELLCSVHIRTRSVIIKYTVRFMLRISAIYTSTLE